jgi:hypothetical protein
MDEKGSEQVIVRVAQTHETKSMSLQRFFCCFATDGDVSYRALSSTPSWRRGCPHHGVGASLARTAQLHSPKNAYHARGLSAIGGFLVLNLDFPGFFCRVVSV